MDCNAGLEFNCLTMDFDLLIGFTWQLPALAPLHVTAVELSIVLQPVSDVAVTSLISSEHLEFCV